MLFALLVSVQARARAETGTRYVFSSESDLWIEGWSTLHNYQCKTRHIEGSLTLADGTARTIRTVDVSIPVHGLQCNNNRMNRVMAQALRAHDHDRIVYSLRESCTQAATGHIAVVLTRGFLTIAGARKEIEMTVHSEQLLNGGLRFFGRHELLMSDYGIERPAALLGALTTSDLVVVHFDVTAVPQGRA